MLPIIEFHHGYGCLYAGFPVRVPRGCFVGSLKPIALLHPTFDYLDPRQNQKIHYDDRGPAKYPSATFKPVVNSPWSIPEVFYSLDVPQGKIY